MHYLLNSLQRAKMERSLMQPFLYEVVHFARWSHRSHLAVCDLTEADIQRFLDQHLPRCGCPLASQTSIAQILYLQGLAMRWTMLWA